MEQLLSVSQTIGTSVYGRAGELIGRLEDAVARVQEPGDERFPPLTGLVVHVGGWRGHNVFVPWEAVRSLSPAGVHLSSSRLDLRPFARRDGELLVVHDVLDKQVVDVQGRRVVRVNDVQLAPDPRSPGGWRVAAADVSLGSFIARVVPKAMARSVLQRLPASAIPWDQVEFFASDVPDVKLRVEHTELARMHPLDIARVIAELSYRQGDEVLTALDHPTAADVVEYLPSELQSAVLTTLPDDKAGDILDEMEPDDAADILAELPEQEVHDLLEAMEPDEAAEVSRLLAHPPDTAGGLMTTEFVALPQTLTVGQAVDELRRMEALPELVPYVYTVDPETGGRLTGAVTLRDLLLAARDQPLQAVARQDILSVTVEASAQEAAELLAEYDLIALPVLDGEGRLLGVITVDDALDVLLPPEWKPRLPRIVR
ncbi:MAG TPA: CBS domain-containing protein [Chloroflexota bacterium]|nr:CBS domain-containing protein [Chloroflexota bacterium]